MWRSVRQKTKSHSLSKRGAEAARTKGMEPHRMHELVSQ